MYANSCNLGQTVEMKHEKNFKSVGSFLSVGDIELWVINLLFMNRFDSNMPRPHALCALRSACNNTQGSALVLALVMVTIVTGMIGIIMMAVQLQWRFIREEQNRIQALYLAEAGVYKTLWYLSGNGGKDIGWRPENELVELFDDETASITVKEWGGYLRITSTAQARHVAKSLRALAGEMPSSAFQQAIVIGGVDYPLVVTGRNRIIGNVTVGPEGVKKGRIKGRDFDGENLVDGKIDRQNKPQRPYFNSALFHNVLQKYLLVLADSAKHLLQSNNVVLSQIQDERIHVEGDLHINLNDSTQKVRGPKRISSSKNVLINGATQILDNVELVAGGKIIVTDHAVLRNCVLFARTGIEVSGESQINGQLLSTGDIILKERSVLHYPSVVYCRSTFADNAWRGRILLQDQTVVRGTLILDSGQWKRSKENNETIVQITPNAKVVGAVYSMHNTEHRGQVIGSIITGQVFLYESPTIYLNWLQDAITDRAQLPEGFLLPIGFSAQPQLDVLHWEEVKLNGEREMGRNGDEVKE